MGKGEDAMKQFKDLECLSRSMFKYQKDVFVIDKSIYIKKIME